MNGRDQRGLAPLLGYLRGRGLSPQPMPPAAGTPVQQMVGITASTWRKSAGWWPAPSAAMCAVRADDFPRQADGYGQVPDDHARSRTDPDDAERRTGIYRPEGRWPAA